MVVTSAYLWVVMWVCSEVDMTAVHWVALWAIQLVGGSAVWMDTSMAEQKADAWAAYWVVSWVYEMADEKGHSVAAAME